MRFFLAFWVLVFHQTAPDGMLATWRPAWGYPVLRTGYLAVSFFFVLSGFILSYTYSLEIAWDKAAIGKFAVARFARVYPVYFLGLVMVAPIVFGVAVKHGHWGMVSLSAGLNISLLQAWVPTLASTWNYPGWSLSDEMFFYACFPLVGFLLWSRTRSRSSSLMYLFLGWCAALAVPAWTILAHIHGFSDVPATSTLEKAPLLWSEFVKFNPLFRIPEFCCGIVACKLFTQLQKAGSWLIGRGHYLYIPAMLVEVFFLLTCDHLPYPIVHNGLFMPLHVAIILGLALGGGPIVRALSTLPILFLGAASYALYIVQFPVAF